VLPHESRLCVVSTQRSLIFEKIALTLLFIEERDVRRVQLNNDALITVCFWDADNFADVVRVADVD
jgi:hypothetical protein